MEAQRFRATVTAVGARRVGFRVPFDPDEVFGAKQRHHVAGTVAGARFRAVIEPVEGGSAIALGPAWLRDGSVGLGDEVDVVLSPEGPQRAELPEDLAAALDADPAAGVFFDSLAQFYRKGYLQWIEATRRSPQRRAERIAQTVRLLAEGHKSRPRP